VTATRTYIAVCGPDPAPARVVRDAEEVGRLLARAGAVVVCGGIGGAMEAAARGAASEGGIALGLLPDADRSRANDYLTVSVPTGMGEMRNTLVVRAADAVIAIEGEFGTLSEIAFALKTGVPVVGLRTWELAKHGTPVSAFRTVESPEMAVREALRLAASDGRPTRG
jgi:uncharacterized protein (TIGR00725 family)